MRFLRKKPAVLLSLSVLFLSGYAMLQARTDVRFTMADDLEKSLREATLGSDFKDPWVDDLHLGVIQGIRALEKYGAITAGVSNSGDMFKDRNVNRFIKETDSNGETYIRVYLGSDTSKDDPFAKSIYSYSIYAYFYIDNELQSLKRVQFQVYRVNFIPGKPLFRELRRIIHPSPGILKDRIGDTTEPPQTASNSDLRVEYFTARDGGSPFQESADGVPSPVINVDPDMTVKIKDDPGGPIPYEDQVKILSLYRKLMQRSLFRLDYEVKLRSLERPIVVEKTLDFND